MSRGSSVSPIGAAWANAGSMYRCQRSGGSITCRSLSATTCCRSESAMAVESNIGVMSSLRPYVRTTGFANWNRYAAVNDEFIDIHMDPDAARAVGMPDAFGMGNLRIAYLHNLLYDWLDGQGDIVEVRCELRGLNFKGDVLTCHGTAAGERSVDGHDLVDLDLGVRNQDDVETTPGSATVVRFRGGAAMPPLPAPTRASGAA